jgi:hypothetical protein
MPAVIEVEYFNTFWLKKIVDNGKEWGSQGAAQPNGLTPQDETSFQPIWPGSDPAGANVCGTNTSIAGGFGLGFYPLPTVVNDPPGTTQEDIDYGKQQEGRCWFIEESRIRGGFNNAIVDLGVKAYITEEMPVTFHRPSSMIYSGVFNGKTNVNETNQFPTGSEITKTADPHYGSLQKLYAEDSNLLLFQENKVSRALIDKDAIYSAEGAGTVTTSPLVIGQITPYVGEYGISRNPESFALYGFRKYFIDKDRGCVLRLSRDGMTEISSYGMSDYFRDELARISDGAVNFTTTASAVNITGIVKEFEISATNTSTVPILGSLVSVQDSSGVITTVSGCYVIGVSPNSSVVNGWNIETSKSININSTSDTIIFSNDCLPRLVGGWDIHNKCYTVSLQSTPNYFPLPSQNYEESGVLIPPSIGYSTLSFDDAINGWVSFYTYNPTFMGSLKDGFYSFNKGNTYLHYSNIENQNNYQTYYGVQSEASITFIFNPSPSISKNFLTINYEGSNGWEMDTAVSGYQGYQVIPQSNAGQNWNANTVGNWVQLRDSTTKVRSNTMGAYTDADGDFGNSGFALKENKYVANLVNNSEQRPGEVIFETGYDGRNNRTSGIKGYFATVKMSTDSDTNPFGPKELFAVGSVYQLSSQ